ncbi:hypothetical protein THZB04_20626 [Vibrio owensii]|nr:hypothetical protein THZB04_20626 [Vibrio owensii]
MVKMELISILPNMNSIFSITSYTVKVKYGQAIRLLMKFGETQTRGIIGQIVPILFS